VCVCPSAIDEGIPHLEGGETREHNGGTKSLRRVGRKYRLACELVRAQRDVRPRLRVGIAHDARGLDTVETKLLPFLHYYPHGVTEKDGDAFNVLTVIKKNCRPDDFVVFILDIDTPIEEFIALKTMTDPEIIALLTSSIGRNTSKIQ